MTKRWRSVAAATGLIDEQGAAMPTIFAEMSALAARTNAANLGQGFPDEDGPEWIRQAAVQAILEGENQYAPGRGIPALRQAVADHQAAHYGLTFDPDTEVLITAGATEAIAAAVLALAGPGDEVVTIEPFYDSHAASIAMAGATHVAVPLVPVPVQGSAGGSGPHGANGEAAVDAGRTQFRLDLDALRGAVSSRTRVILVNTPHNPTGTVLTRTELEAIAAEAQRVDAIVITDEVYEHLLFDGATHVPIATLPGMRERTLTISSAGKTFSLTGWKIGWVTGPAALIDAVLAIKQFLTYTNGSPFQPAIAAALSSARGAEDIAALRATLDARRTRLLEGLADAGFTTVRPDGTYFVCADATPFLSASVPDGAAFARWLPEAVGVACVPLSAFCRKGSPTAEALANWVRFTFVKQDATLETAIERLRGLGGLGF